MLQKRKRRFLILLPLFFLIFLSGCAKMRSVINDIHGSLIGNNYTIYTYDNYGSQTLKTSGKRSVSQGTKSKLPVMTVMERKSLVMTFLQLSPLQLTERK